MSFLGKVLGGAFGFMLAGPLGALMGVAFGHQFDKGLRGLSDVEGNGLGRGAPERVQMAFFTATFAIMGRIAKADGHVSPSEIALAENIMQQLGATGELKQVAKRLFNEGKQPGFDFNGVLVQLKRELGRRQTLARMFLEIQVLAAYADGSVHPAEAEILREVASALGFSAAELAEIEALVRATQQGGARGARPATPSLAEDYATLGIAKSASDDEMKRAYRRLMSQHHPDKLVAKGLPEEMMKVAEEKTRQIRSAYERIRAARGL
ncbi:MAG: co-chaperone DjlA [Gammaproteobacteria bacterium]